MNIKQAIASSFVVASLCASSSTVVEAAMPETQKQHMVPQKEQVLLADNTTLRWLEVIVRGIELYERYQERQRQQERQPQQRQQQPQIRFPLATCGSSAPTRFPAVRYRVYIDYDPEVLRIVKSQLCRNAWEIGVAPHNGERMIVLLSVSEEYLGYANAFAKELRPYFPNASVHRVVLEGLRN